MADRSAIEWTDATWNPIRARSRITGKVGWHCEHVTTGCEHCYAESFNQRLGTGLPFKPGHRKDIEILVADAILTQPMRWKKPRKIFVCSMTDLFADFVSDEWLHRIFAVMALTPHHTYQVVTKRAERMRDYLAPGRERMQTRWLWAARDTLGCHADGGIPPQFPLPNVWLGVSTERQQEADERIPLLLGTPAVIRFISAEPLLGPINLTSINHRGVASGHSALHDRGLGQLDWVIAGGESGPKARPSHPEWIRSLRDQCAAAGAAFHFKQWGEWHDCEEYSSEQQESYDVRGLAADGVIRVGKNKAGRRLDGRTHDEFPTPRTQR